ncbi:hypothetical protein B0H13DRAFT_1923830 [Mycena leptocephala]|nr:hypothetical protein B0H13DRAFT_1923830 [Mycena leptocephala]
MTFAPSASALMPPSHCLTILLTTGPYRLQIAEFVDTKIQNSTCPRQLFMHGKDLWIIPQHMEYENLISHSIFIPHLIPEAVRDLLLYYLVVFPPVLIILLRLVKGEEIVLLYDKYLWVPNSQCITSGAFSHLLAAWTGKYYLSNSKFRRIGTSRSSSSGFPQPGDGAGHRGGPDSRWDAWSQYQTGHSAILCRDQPPADAFERSSPLTLQPGSQVLGLRPGKPALQPLVACQALLEQNIPSIGDTDYPSAQFSPATFAPVYNMLHNMTAVLAANLHSVGTRLERATKLSVARGFMEILSRQPGLLSQLTSSHRQFSKLVRTLDSAPSIMSSSGMDLDGSDDLSMVQSALSFMDIDPDVTLVDPPRLSSKNFMQMPLDLDDPTLRVQSAQLIFSHLHKVDGRTPLELLREFYDKPDTLSVVASRSVPLFGLSPGHNHGLTAATRTARTVGGFPDVQIIFVALKTMTSAAFHSSTRIQKMYASATMPVALMPLFWQLLEQSPPREIHMPFTQPTLAFYWAVLEPHHELLDFLDELLAHLSTTYLHTHRQGIVFRRATVMLDEGSAGHLQSVLVADVHHSPKPRSLTPTSSCFTFTCTALCNICHPDSTLAKKILELLPPRASADPVPRRYPIQHTLPSSTPTYASPSAGSMLHIAPQAVVILKVTNATVNQEAKCQLADIIIEMANALRDKCTDCWGSSGRLLRDHDADHSLICNCDGTSGGNSNDFKVFCNLIQMATYNCFACGLPTLDGFMHPDHPRICRKQADCPEGFRHMLKRAV